MRILFGLATALTLFLHTASAQPQWEQVGTYVFAEGVIVHKNVLLVSAPGNGFFRSTDEGVTWLELDPHLDFIFDFEVVDQTLFAAATTKGVYRSTDNGLTWARSSAGITTEKIHRVDYRGAVLFALTDAGLFISNDNGDQWSSTDGPLRNTKVRAVEALRRENGDLVYIAGTFDQGLFFSQNDGLTWEGMEPTGLPDTPVFLSIKAFTEVNGTLFMGTNQGLFRSNNEGNSWEPVPFPDVTYPDVQYLESAGNSLLCIFDSRSLYYSTDHGNRWENIAANFPPVFPRALFIADEYIYVGTHGESLQRLRRSDLTTDVPPSLATGEVTLVPNPVDDVLHVHGLQSITGTTITLYSVTGEQVRSIRNTPHIGVGDLPSGMYFVEIRSKTGSVRTSTLILR